MGTLMSYLAGFGLATGVGAKAFVPVVLLGALHYTPYFELSERWLWIADPVVMSILGVLALAEILVDSIPELAEYGDVVAYLPKLVVGFIGFAAVTGSLDQDLSSLAGSGVLGGGTATAVHWLRTKVRRPWRLAIEGLHPGFGRAASLSEAGLSATLAGTAMIAPPVSIGIALLGFGVAWAVWKTTAGRRAPCPHCGGPTRSGALACPHCSADLGSPAVS